MKTISRQSLYGKNVHIVEFEDKELAMTKEEMISYVDNGGQSLKSYHYGGSVTQRTDNVFEVIVYTD